VELDHGLYIERSCGVDNWTHTRAAIIASGTDACNEKAFSVVSSNNFGNVEIRNAVDQGVHCSLLNLLSVCL
jgi:hypothetical protein